LPHYSPETLLGLQPPSQVIQLCHILKHYNGEAVSVMLEGRGTDEKSEINAAAVQYKLHPCPFPLYSITRNSLQSSIPQHTGLTFLRKSASIHGLERIGTLDHVAHPLLQCSISGTTMRPQEEIIGRMDAPVAVQDQYGAGDRIEKSFQKSFIIQELSDCFHVFRPNFLSTRQIS
jgi:hypothetical protein